MQLVGDLRYRQVAVHGLAAGHGDGVVVEDLVGGVDAGGHRRADRQRAGMEVGAVAEVDENMALFGEGRLAHPGRAFAAHVGEGGRGAVHPQHHEVAADARQSARTLRHPGRTVVRTAGAEVGRARDRDHRRGGAFLGLDDRQPVADARRGEVAADAVGDDAGDLRRRQFAGGGQQPATVGQGPFALFVELADHARAHVFAPVVELLLQLVFDQLALFLDYQYLLQPFGEMPYAIGLERPDHADLVQPDAEFGGEPVVDAEVVERLAHIEVGLAGGDDPQPRIGRVDHDLVQPVGAAIRQRGIQLVIEQARFLHQAIVGPADVEAVRRQGVIGG